MGAGVNIEAKNSFASLRALFFFLHYPPRGDMMKRKEVQAMQGMRILLALAVLALEMPEAHAHSGNALRAATQLWPVLLAGAPLLPMLAKKALTWLKRWRR